MFQKIKSKKLIVVLSFFLFLLIGGVCFWNANLKGKDVSAAGESWLTGWGYRKPITINNTSAGIAGTINGNPVLGGAGKFGTGINFDGTGDYVSFGGIGGLSSDFTVDLWGKVNTSDSTYDILIADSRYNVEGSFNLFVDLNGKLNLYTTVGGAQASRITGTTTVGNSGNWFHVAVVRSSGVVKMYVNGTQEGGTWSTTTTFFPLNGYIGSDNCSANGCGNTDLTGYIDEVRISNYARWTTTFVPPTSAYTVDSYTKSLFHLNETVGSATVYSDPALANYQVKIESSLYNETGLMGSWHMNEASGTVVEDSSGNLNTGTANGTTITTGKFGNARTFNGTTDVINLANATSLSPGSSDFTTESWFKTTATGAYKYIYWDSVDATNAPSIQFGIAADNKLNCLFRDSSSNQVSIGASGAVVTDGNWHHGACVRDGTTARLYLDGVQIATNTNTSLGAINTSTGRIPRIGGASTGEDVISAVFSGALDEVKLYSRALSASEISAQYVTSKALSDYGDIRFTSSDGSTELSYWMEKDGTFWVKVPSLASGNNTVYMYYGNSSVATTSNGNNTFMQWHGLATSTFIDSVITLPSRYIYEACGGPTSASHTIDWGLSNLPQREDDHTSIESYTAGNTRYGFPVNDAVGTTTNNETPSFTNGIKYKMKIIVTETAHTYSVDNDPIGTFVTTTLPNEPMGLQMNLLAGTGVQQWSFIRSYASTEPTLSFGSEEVALPVADPYCSATGGTITRVDGYCVHTFTSSGTFNTNTIASVEYLVVAGGGGGGGTYGSGGGGAGGLLTNVGGTRLAVSGNVSVVVGAGGAPATVANYNNGYGFNGGNSSFGSVVAIGGGGGAYLNVGAGGGSGGGSSRVGASRSSGTAGQGNGGGAGYDSPSYASGGGGGAGGAGADGSASKGGAAGAGGAGLQSSITGSSVYYAAGGGAGGDYFDGRSTAALGGSGIGGNGATGTVVAGNGVTNTGSGGGGSGQTTSGTSVAGGSGGSGVVIVRYPIPTTLSYRKPITVNNTSNASTLTGYQILVTVDTASLITAGKIQSDCDDIRFTDDSTSYDTAGWYNNYPYWIESGCNTSTTKIWVKVDSIAASSNKTIYMYYGNSSAFGLSNGDNAFDFFDDFSGTSLNITKWTTVGSPSVNTVSSGILDFETNAGSQYIRSNYISTSGTAIRTKQKDGTSATYPGEISFGIRTGGGVGKIAYTADQNCFLVNNGTSETYTAGVADDDNWHVWDITWLTSEAKFFRDGVQQGGTLTTTIPTMSLPVIVGALDAWASVTTFTNMDWIFVRKYTSIEPIATVGDEITAAVLTEVTPVPTPTSDTTPNYVFSSDKTGTITYGGDCSSATTTAVVGNNTITFNTLTAGTHSNCTIAVGSSNVLNIPSFTIVSFPVYTSPNMSCTLTMGACNGTNEVSIFKLYDPAGNHAELSNQSNYSYRVCCTGAGLSNSCSATYKDTVLRLSNTTNAHVEKDTSSGYTGNEVCLSSSTTPITCSYSNTTCSALGTNYVCLASISGDTNAHVGECATYTNKVCCDASVVVDPCTAKVASNKFISAKDTNIQLCSGADITNPADPCYSVCWKGTGAPVVTSSNWACGVCHNSSNVAVPCTADNSTFNWVLPSGYTTPADYTLIDSTTLTSPNPIVRFVTQDSTRRVTLNTSNYGVTCSSSTTVQLLPKWKEITPFK